jgi:hypothetical protein
MKKVMITLILGSLCYVATATVLGDLAASMKAGEWRTLTTAGAVAALGQTGGATGNTIPYANNGVWDPVGHAFYFLGSDHFHSTGYARFITYSENTNGWTTLARPAWFWSLTETAMHGYDHSGLDQATGLFYHSPFIKGGGSRTIYRYNVRTNTWLSPFMSPYSSACCIGMEYFPEYHGLIFTDGAAGIYGCKIGATNTWQLLKSGATMGDYHNMSEYNPVHKVVVGGGGNSNSAMYKIDSNGTVTTLKNAPVTFRILENVLTVDPVGGDFLLFTLNKEFYAYDVLTDTWTLQTGTVPPIYTTGVTGGAVACVIASPIPEYGINMFVSCNGANDCWVSLYKRTASAKITDAILAQSTTASLTVSPNPVTRSASVRVGGIKPVECKVLDVRGRLFQTMRISASNGMSNQFTWDASKMPAGFYLMQVTDGNKTLIQKVFIQK